MLKHLYDRADAYYDDVDANGYQSINFVDYLLDACLAAGMLPPPRTLLLSNGMTLDGVATQNWDPESDLPK